MNRGLVYLTPAALAAALELPSGSVIDGVAWDCVRSQVVIGVQHPDLPKMLDGEVAPQVHYEVEVVRRWRL